MSVAHVLVDAVVGMSLMWSSLEPLLMDEEEAARARMGAWSWDDDDDDDVATTLLARAPIGATGAVDKGVIVADMLLSKREDEERK